jgi:anthranilate phosphoribosyltransferase
LIRDALGNRRGQYAEKAADIIALNAGAAIYVSGVASTLSDGVEMARDAIGSSLAGEKIRELAAFTQYLE